MTDLQFKLSFLSEEISCIILTDGKKPSACKSGNLLGRNTRVQTRESNTKLSTDGSHNHMKY